ncbi:hypothetical protein [Nocardia sp. SC052]|uniref:hypothetical protein n=1 Tax=Nocardia sichangensis TaxID=3385975 RepID=UPI0039A05A47
MGRDFYSPDDIQERQMLALERIADVLETLPSRDAIVDAAIRERMQPGDYHRAVDPSGEHRFGGTDGEWVKVEAAEAGLTVERLWTYTATEYRPEMGTPR